MVSIGARVEMAIRRPTKKCQGRRFRLLSAPAAHTLRGSAIDHTGGRRLDRGVKSAIAMGRVGMCRNQPAGARLSRIRKQRPLPCQLPPAHRRDSRLRIQPPNSLGCILYARRRTRGLRGGTTPCRSRAMLEHGAEMAADRPCNRS
jgi:hypothetical protein